MASVQHYNIDKLDYSNYATWSSDMRFILLEKNAWGITIGTEKEPIYDKSKPLPEEVADFRSRAVKALTYIYLHLTNDFKKIVEKCETPFHAWEKLRLHFQPDNRSQQMTLFTQICSARIAPNESINMFAARLRRLKDQFDIIDDEMPEMFISFQLLRYLPPHFDSISQSIVRWEKSRFIFDDIVKELIAEETRLHLREGDRRVEETYEASKANKYRSKRRIRCYGCGKYGHTKSTCTTNNNRNRSQKRDDEPTFRKPSTSPSGNSCRKSPDQHKFRHKTLNSRNTSSSNSEGLYIQASAVEATGAEDNFVFDTAASHHFVNDISLLESFTPLNEEKIALAIDNVSFPIKGKGVMRLKFGPRIVKFNDVLYVPNLRRNLISGPKLDITGACFKGQGGLVKAKDSKGEELFTAKLKRGIYVLNPKPVSKSKKSVSFEASSAQLSDVALWHRRFGHVYQPLLKRTSQLGCVRGLPRLKFEKHFCEICKLNKHKHVPFKSLQEIRSKRPLDLLHVDTWGPTRTEGRKGERYYLSIVDDYSRRAAIYPLVSKYDVYNTLKLHIERAETYLNSKVKAIRSDNGTEFKNRAVTDFLDSKGIKHELTNIYSPQQNGVAERLNQTALNATRAILDDSGLPLSFWPEAIMYFAYTWNRCVHTNMNQTPFQRYTGKPPSVRHLRPFGCIVYVGIPKQHRTSKFDRKAQKAVLMGYAKRTRGYRVYLPEKDSIVETINVSFDEQSLGSGAVLGARSQLATPPIVEIFHDEPTITHPLVPDSQGTLEDSKVEEHDSDSESDPDEPTGHLKRTLWRRELRPRKTGKKIDVYFYEVGKKRGLATQGQIKDYCQKHNLIYNDNLFQFSSKDKYEGVIADTEESSTSHASA